MKITTWNPHPGATTTSFRVIVVYEGTGSLDSSFSCTTTTNISKSGGNSTRPSMKNWMIEKYVPNTLLDKVRSVIKRELARLVCETFMRQNLRHKVGDHIHNIAYIRLHILYRDCELHVSSFKVKTQTTSPSRWHYLRLIYFCRDVHHPLFFLR